MYFIMLVGPPGAGKSTYIKQHLPEEFLVLSKDQLIFNEADRTGKSYDEAYNDYGSRAYELLLEQIKVCVNKSYDCVLDMTNVSEESRKQKLYLIPNHVTKIAVYFPAYTPEVLKKRIEKRAKEGGHDVPLEGIQKMHERYRLPQKTEGFDLVVSSSHFIDIMKVMKFK